MTALGSEFEKPYFLRLSSFLDKERTAGKTIYPREENVFKALNECSPADVKAVILGQDPYHEDGQAMGLSFSVPDGVPAPPSLRNIMKELYTDVGVQPFGGQISKNGKLREFFCSIPYLQWSGGRRRAIEVKGGKSSPTP